MKRIDIFFGIIKIPLDFFMTILGFFAAFQLRILTEKLEGFAKPIDYSVIPSTKEYLIFSASAATALIIIFAVGRMYSLKGSTKFSQETKKVIVFGIVWTMAIITYFFFTRTFPFSRLAILYSWILAIIFIIGGRAIISIIERILLSYGIGQNRILLIGNNKISRQLFKLLKKDKNYKIVGLIGKNKSKKNFIKQLGSIEKLESIIQKYKIDEVIQTKSSNSKQVDEEILEICDLHHISYRFVPDLIGLRTTNIINETIGTIPIITLKPTPLDGWGKVIKRILDIIGSIFGLIILSPIFLITAIAIKMDSKGPIFFTKLDNGDPVKRVGKKGELFKFYKFRSMHPNSHNLRYTKLAENNIRTDGPLVKIKDDPRVTKVGKFIRKYNLDEFPQLWNVLIGNMSLVGPRPHLPEEVEKYQKNHRFVLTIKPGITGLAQVSGRSDLKFEDEVKLDRFYIENWSVWSDIKIIFKTVLHFFKGYEE